MDGGHKKRASQIREQKSLGPKGKGTRRKRDRNEGERKKRILPILAWPFTTCFFLLSASVGSLLSGRVFHSPCASAHTLYFSRWLNYLMTSLANDFSPMTFFFYHRGRQPEWRRGSQYRSQSKRGRSGDSNSNRRGSVNANRPWLGKGGRERRMKGT